jgi:hypothetical protein
MTSATEVPASATAPSRPRTAPPEPEGTSYQRLWNAVEALDLSEEKRTWMQDRWLYEVWWFDRRAEQSNRKHSALRVIAICGGVLVPAFVSVSSTSTSLEVPARWAAFIVSVLVALAVGLDSFYHFGDRWRHYRRTAELLTMEGWQFIERAGRYREKPHHHRADFHNHEFARFATQVEQLIRQDVEVYLTRIVQERTEPDQDEEESADGSAGASGTGTLSSGTSTPDASGTTSVSGPET